MKKYFFAMLAVVFVVVFAAFKSTDRTKDSKRPNTSFARWYNISSNKVVSEFTEGAGMSETEILAGSPPCQDNGSTVCLVGTNGTLQTDDVINPALYSSDALIAHN